MPAKTKRSKKGIVVKPILSSEFNSRCQVDLIDYQSHPDREYKFVIVYQDPLTKFVILRALKTKRADEVAFTVCHQEFLKKEDVPNQETTLRTVANLQSTCTGQGFVKCTCKKHCDTKKC